MPASLAAFLADAGIPVDSVTPREARRMLIRARGEARNEARAEARREREARRYGMPAVGEAATLEIKPLPKPATEASR
jgi:hypothetical protein